MSAKLSKQNLKLLNIILVKFPEVFSLNIHLVSSKTISKTFRMNSENLEAHYSLETQ